MTIGPGSANRLKLAKITTSQNTSTTKNGSGIASSPWVNTSSRVRPMSVVSWMMRDFSEVCSGVGGLQPFDRIVEALGHFADDKGRSAALARGIFLPDARGRGRYDLPQHGSRRLRFRPVLGQHLVDHDGMGAELPDVGVLAVIGVFRRGDHQPDHERGQRRQEAGTKADGLLDPPSSSSAGKARFRRTPIAAPIRIETKEARNAAVELMASSLWQRLHVIPG